ncbi:MarR family transcriptional regulator [Sphaerisporangium krabiense]|uniref:DNA-binding MarR family transcriptional regulator n=1 Tax=Sphaerisporangium krabiense TaxID=763782 RepID=A0A7W8Z3X6_9ACTN|nr:MarR family transcriptional regulator [Sphaerisporangium krabiense]MBB5626966.1 DNA-binding MarR family transcriptional regulator [Sphaerisporangium krabiense]GII66768.1 MarR family transcriptional regulator [Sphaerisporangium krabiense]
MELDEPAGKPLETGNPPTPDDAAQLGSDLRVAIARIARRLRQAHAVGDVTISGVSVLARLAEGPDSPGSLAELERVRPQAMATTLASLEERGLVRRGQDAADGRRAIMTITDEGRRVLSERRSESERRLAEVLGAEFTPAERHTLASAVSLLDRLAERL